MITNLGNDKWASECRQQLRHGLRSHNRIDFGGLRIWRLYDKVILTDGDNDHELPIACQSEAKAVLEMERIAEGIERGFSLVDIIDVPESEIPAELLNAWIH